ncbi:hypothetical protein A4G19_07910 [Pasteurellaceae bacterium Macca]|nr:hypothetical protein [Pasteurellaceae bacterium Macca]
MKWTQIKQTVKQWATTLAERYQQLEDYFNNGSFGVKFYPWLMSPYARYSYTLLIKVSAVLAVFLGIYTFFAEFLTIGFSEVPFISAYSQHSFLEFSVPIGTTISEQTVGLSPLAFTLRATFFLQGCFFFLIYFVGAPQVSEHRFRLLGLFSALLFSGGMWITFSTYGGKYLEGGLYNLGFNLTYLFGNLAIACVGLSVKKPDLLGFKRYTLTVGSLGLISAIVLLFVSSPYFSIIERLSLYSLFSWEVAFGFAILKRYAR